MRKKIVAGNWKMNNDLFMTKDLIHSIKSKLNNNFNTEVFISPSFPFLLEAKKNCNNTKINVTAQNINENESGAYTGEVSSSMLKSIGVNSVIIGHSERRQYFNENDHILLKKLKKAMSEKFKVFFCVGENINERENNNHFNIIEKQLNNTVFKIDSFDVNNLIIAYEPVWAIGTGLTASPEQAQEMHFFIREIFKSKYGSEISNNLSIIYGGSVKPSSAKDIFGKKDVDGGLIGGASLRAQDFIDIVNSI
jgi:triosephosphate isomerase